MILTRALAALAAVTFLIGACAAPQYIEVPVEVPPIEVPVEVPPIEVPVPGPTVYVETVPDVCVEALDRLVAIIAAENDILTMYADGREPSQAQVDTFLALDPDAAFGAANACVEAWAAGSVPQGQAS